MKTTCVRESPLSEHIYEHELARRWKDVANGVPSDFGFAMAIHPTDEDMAWIVPLEADMFRCTPEGKLRVYRRQHGLRGGQIGFCRTQRVLEILGFNPCDDLARLHGIADAHGSFQQPATDPES